MTRQSAGAASFREPFENGVIHHRVDSCSRPIKIHDPEAFWTPNARNVYQISKNSGSIGGAEAVLIKAQKSGKPLKPKKPDMVLMMPNQPLFVCSSETLYLRFEMLSLAGKGTKRSVSSVKREKLKFHCVHVMPSKARARPLSPQTCGEHQHQHGSILAPGTAACQSAIVEDCSPDIASISITAVPDFPLQTWRINLPAAPLHQQWMTLPD